MAFYLLRPISGTPARLLLRSTAVLAAIALLAAGCGSTDDTSDSDDSFVNNQSPNTGENNQDEPPGDPTVVSPERIDAVDTVAPDTVQAGDTIDIECIYLDASGEQVTPSETPPTRAATFPDTAFDENDDGDMIAVQAGDAQAACQVPSLGLVDEDPAAITITPGDVYTTTADVETYQVVAGTTVDMTCGAFDEFGNTIEDADFEIVSDISSSGIVTDNDELTISVTSTGIFLFSCHVEGTQNRFGDPLEVLPDKPSDLFVDVMPNQSTYGVEQVIRLDVLVEDRFGNPIDYPQMDFQADEPHETFGDSRYRFSEDGTYTMSVEVTEDTHDDKTLYEEVEVVINASGPDINCEAPFDGEMIDHTPGDPISFDGMVSDAHSVDSLSVNGDSVSLTANGNGGYDFSTTVDTHYGVNFVDIAATDEFGEQNVRTCAFMVADAWQPENESITDGISLSLFQEAVDDGNFNGDIDSLNDLLMTALNSDGIENMMLDELDDFSQSDSITVSFVSCSYTLYVEDIDITSGPLHVTSLDLIDGGLTMEATLNEVFLELFVDVGWCFGNLNPEVDISSLDLSITADMELVNGEPSLSLNNVNSVESGQISISGQNWFSDALYSGIESIVQGTLRSTVEDTFEDVIVDNFDPLLGDLISSLEVSELGAEFEVPRLDSDGTMALGFTPDDFSTIDVDPDRALFGIAPRIFNAGSGGHGIASPGAPYPQTSLFIQDPDPAGVGQEYTASAAVHIALLNQALHALWRGGLFHADVGGSLGDDLPDGASVMLESNMPPMVALNDDGSAELMMGAVTVELVLPGIFDDPVALTVGLTAETGIDLSGLEIAFDGITLDDFYLSPNDISINSDTRDILEDFLADLFQDIVDQSLNAALPALPIPSFEIPATMAQFGLNQGAELGLYNISVDQNSRFIELDASFGIE